MTDNNKTTYAELSIIELETEKKGNFNYASWSDVWDEVIKYDGAATYEVKETDKGFPAFINSTGGLVCVKVTIKGITRSQWLPIMDYRNQSIKKDLITSMDINKSIQRCMVKCVALFGLGLWIFKGEEFKNDEENKTC